MRILATSAVLITAIANMAAGQVRGVEPTLPLVFTGAVRAIEPPAQAGEWALQVISRGGFDHRGTADLTIKSDGTVTLVAPDNRAASIHPNTLVSLNERIRTVATPRWGVNSRLGICSDCPATLIVLRVREPNGLVSTYTAFWDAVTKGTIPEDLRRIHDLAMTIHER
jgi:hypothetical protein